MRSKRKPRNVVRGFVVDWVESVEIASEFFRAGGVAHLSERLGLNLAYTLSGDIKLFAHFFQRVVGVQPDAKAHPDNFGFALGEAI